jgi:hypothetical protein
MLVAALAATIAFTAARSFYFTFFFSFGIAYQGMFPCLSGLNLAARNYRVPPLLHKRWYRE